MKIDLDRLLLEAGPLEPGVFLIQRCIFIEEGKNINNGERLETYIINGKKGTGEITLNGPAARKVQKGDKIIIISYARMNLEEAKTFNPTLIFPNKDNILI